MLGEALALRVQAFARLGALRGDRAEALALLLDALHHRLDPCSDAGDLALQRLDLGCSRIARFTVGGKGLAYRLDLPAHRFQFRLALLALGRFVGTRSRRAQQGGDQQEANAMTHTGIVVRPLGRVPTISRRRGPRLYSRS